MLKKISMESPWNIWKTNMLKWHTTSKTEHFKRVIFIMTVLSWSWLKWRKRAVSKECCGYSSHSLDAYQASRGWSPWTSRHFCRNSSKALQPVFLWSLKRKGLEVTFCQHEFKFSVQEHHIVSPSLFLWSNYQLSNFMTGFYFPLALVR